MLVATTTKQILSRSFSSSTSTAASKIAVVGTGRMGKIRVAGMLSNPTLASVSHVVAENAETASVLSAQFPSVNVTTSVDDVLSDDSVDGVWISTPTHLHVPLIKSIAAASKHIAVEKPVAASVSDITLAYEYAAAADVKLLCSFQRRFDASYVSLKNRLDSIGAVQSIVAIFRDHPTPPIEFLKTGGDPFHDLAVHDIDYVCDILKEYPTKVTASGTSFNAELKDAGVMDKANVSLTFPSGVVCMMDLSRGSSYGYDQRIEVFGQDGMLQVLNQSVTNVVSSTANAGIAADVYIPSFPTRFAQAYNDELVHFCDVIKDPSVLPAVTKSQAQMATVVAEAAKISAEENCSISLDENISDFSNVRYTKC